MNKNLNGSFSGESFPGGYFPAETFKEVLDCSTSAIYVADCDTQELILTNDKFLELTGKSFEECVGKKCWSILGSNKGKPCVSCPMKNLVDKEGNIKPPKTVEQYIVEKGIWASINYSVLRWPGEKLVQVGTINDITDSKRMESELSQLAFFDKKMGLPNLSSLEAELKKSDIGEFTLICIDIIGLTKINDVFGRNVGDALLDSIRNWMIAIEGVPVSIFYRVGGDEFCLLIKQTGHEDMNDIYRQIWNRFEEPWIIKSEEAESNSIYCSICMGVITKYVLGNLNENLIDIIERAITTSKKIGDIAVYSEEVDHTFKEALKLELSLKACVKDGMKGFSVYYQAITNPNTGTWCGIEALCRWNSPEFGFIPPLTFIKIAEEHGLIGAIGMWILEESVKQVKDWGLDKIEQFFLDVNLSPSQLVDDQLPDKVMAVLEKYDFPPTKLSLEITESSEFNFDTFSMAYIRRLYDMGVMMSLDDFGTGYSSFSNLKYLPVKVIKTDRSFILDLETDEFSQHIFHIMVELAQTVNLKVIAEGVETESQLRLLRKIGVNFFQGYLFCKPLPAHEFEKRLDSFYNSAGVFPAAKLSKIDVKTMEDPSKGYNLTPVLHKLLNRCLHILFYNRNISEAIDQTLKIIGETLGLSRTYVFIKDQGDTYTNINEWCDNGIVPLIGKQRGMTINETWFEAMKSEGLLFTSDFTNLPSIAKEEYNRAGIKATSLIPLWDDNSMIGFVGFDDCVNYRDWSAEEIQMLYSYSVNITDAYIRQGLERAVAGQKATLDAVINHIDVIVFVSDLVTDEILYFNQTAKKFFPLAEKGKTCWKVMGYDEKVTDGIVHELLESPELSKITDERYIPSLGRKSKICDSIIKWYDNRPVHIQYNFEPAE